MPELGAARKGDVTYGPPSHPWLPAEATDGSPNVIVNGLPAVRVGDPFATHILPAPPVVPHDSAAAQGSTTVFANGLALARGPSQGPAAGGDQTSCSDTIAIGSSNVIVGG